MSQQEPNISSVTINVKGDTSGEQYQGVFKFRTRLSFRDQLRRDEIRRQLLGESPNGTQALDRAASAARMFSELAIRIVEAPKWWTNAADGLELEDDNVLISVHDAAIKAEGDRIAYIAKQGEEAKAALEKAAPAAE